jgi:anti-sigma factor RsiW
MNTTHPVAREEVMAFLDGELSAAEAQAISAHLNHCVECTGVVEQFRDTFQSLSRWSVPAVPAKLEHSVRDLADKTRLGLKTAKPGFFLHIGFWTWKHWILFLGSASVTVLLLIGLSAGNFKRARIPANARVQVQAGPPKGPVGPGWPSTLNESRT